jgi:hypothetical protein
MDFWLYNFRVIYNKYNEFYPTYTMTLNEKLNAIFRLSIYIGIILMLITNNYLYMYIPGTIGIFTIIIYKYYKKDFENFFQEYNRIDNECCVKPSEDNPFMNFNQITDDRLRGPACRSYNDEKIKEEITKNFDHNLYRDVSDVYGKNHSQRQFYTMPSTQAISEQTSFAKWCYKTGPTCKENTIKCAAEWSPVD